MNRRGQSSVLYAVILMPTLFLIFALAIDLGALELERLRLHYALDLATLTAATSADATFYSQTGQLRLDPQQSAAVTREYLIRNVTSLSEIGSPDQVAREAEITVLNQVPAKDPYSGALLGRPAICARIKTPYRFNLLTWVGLRTVSITVTSSSEIRR